MAAAVVQRGGRTPYMRSLRSQASFVSGSAAALALADACDGWCMKRGRRKPSCASSLHIEDRWSLAEHEPTGRVSREAQRYLNEGRDGARLPGLRH